MKKTLFSIFIFMLMFSFYTPVSSMGFEPEKTEVDVPILMYHFLATDNRRPNQWKIRVEEFESDLIALKRENFEPVFLQDLIDFVYNGISLPEKPVVITFDDGASDFYKYAFPLLKEHNMKAVMAIIGYTADEYSKDIEQNKYAVPNLTWDQLRELKDSGLVEIQSHSYDMHRGIGAAKKRGESIDSYRARIFKDTAKFNERILSELGHEPTAFIFPFGNKSESSNDILKENGFLASLICHEEISTIRVGDPDSLFDLGRILRSPEMSSDSMIRKIYSLGK